MLEQIGIDIAALQRLVRRYPVREFDDLDVEALFLGARSGELDDIRDRTARCADFQRLGGLARWTNPRTNTALAAAIASRKRRL